MSTVAAAFLLLLAVHGANGPFSLSAIGRFATQAECQRAAATTKAALGTGGNIDFACIAEPEIETLLRNSLVR